MLARRLRRDMTEADKRLWRELCELGLANRFRRQHPIGNALWILPVRQRSWPLSLMAGTTRVELAQTRCAVKKLPNEVTA